MRASTAVLLRAGMVAALAMGAVGLAGRARAQSPIEFWAAQDATHERPTIFCQNLTKKCAHRYRYIDNGTRSIVYSAAVGSSDIIREASRFLGSGNPTGIRAEWCAFFVSMILRATGHRPLANGLSYSALSYGPRLAGPRVGALIVLPRHVGFVARVSGDRVTMLSGNWSGRVALAVLPIRAAIAYIEVN